MKKSLNEISKYRDINIQKYFQHLQPNDARLLFKVRASIVDIKSCRSYKYNDNICRLCGIEGEDINHILNYCPKISRTYIIENFTKPKDKQEEEQIVKRFEEFNVNVEEKEINNEEGKIISDTSN